MKKLITIFLILLFIPIVMAQELTEENIDEILEEITEESVKYIPNQRIRYFVMVRTPEFVKYAVSNQEQRQYRSLIMLKKRQLEHNVMSEKNIRNKERWLEKQEERYTKLFNKIQEMPIQREEIREKVQGILTRNLERHKEVIEKIKGKFDED